MEQCYEESWWRLKSKLWAVRIRLKRHEEGLEKHFKNASDFLVKCQIIEPYIEKGTLRGCVCPWEIGTFDREGFTILEDFHDTLEAIWVWSYYTKLSGKDTYKSNIEKGWEYIIANWERFIPSAQKDEGLYDCSHVILSGALYEKVFADKCYHKLLDFAGDRLASRLLKIRSVRGKGYSDPWWMTACLAYVAQSLKHHKWLEVSTGFVKRNLIEKELPFTDVAKEPRYGGPGGHNFFSINANKVLALLSCLPFKAVAKKMVLQKFLPLAPRQFIKRYEDENPWNANVATALGKCYLSTGEEEFLRGYFVIMDELNTRTQNSVLSRSEKFPVKESWVTFFYAYAYTSVLSK